MELPDNLPETTLALIKLPVPVSQIASLCQTFPGKDVVMHQQGDWIVISKKGAKP